MLHSAPIRLPVVFFPPPFTCWNQHHIDAWCNTHVLTLFTLCSTFFDIYLYGFNMPRHSGCSPPSAPLFSLSSILFRSRLHSSTLFCTYAYTILIRLYRGRIHGLRFTRYGFNMAYPDGVAANSNTAPERALYIDLLRIFQGLHAVTNNGPSTVGGGGNPRVPRKPPICGNQ